MQRKPGEGVGEGEEREEWPRASRIPGVQRDLLCVSDPHSLNPLNNSLIWTSVPSPSGPDGGRQGHRPVPRRKVCLHLPLLTPFPLPASRWPGGPLCCSFPGALLTEESASLDGPSPSPASTAVVRAEGPWRSQAKVPGGRGSGTGTCGVACASGKGRGGELADLGLNPGSGANSTPGLRV